MTESTLAWLDLDEDGRRQMQEKLALLNEPDTVDELGVGQVRDVFSDALHPGTSTLWRRARYMLFVPWIYRQLERSGTGKRSGTEAVRLQQIRLIRALKHGGDTNGLIGARTDEPQRMPDDLLWNGLQRWGIRRREGSLGKYRRSLEAGDANSFAIVRGDFDEVLDSQSGSWWHQRLPAEPDAMLESSNFNLDFDEAVFLRDQLQEHVPDSLLAALTAEPAVVPTSELPWDQQESNERLSGEMREVLDHARMFSYGFRGAGILYSYHVARGRKAPNAEELAARLVEWSSDLEENGLEAEIRAWPRRKTNFWAFVRGKNRGLRVGTTDFVDQWFDVATSTPDALLTSESAAELIKEREWRVKRHLARLSNKKALDRARDEAGTGQLDYRWRQARQIITDIANGLST